MKSGWSAALRFSVYRFSKLTGKVVYQLQRCPASGIYGESYTFKSMWDEYCHEIQNVPSDLSEVWISSIEPFVEGAVSDLAKEERDLLQNFAGHYFGDTGAVEEDDIIDEQAISAEIWLNVISMAEKRSLRKFVYN